MRAIFLSALFIVARFLCLSLPCAALDGHGTDVSSHGGMEDPSGSGVVFHVQSQDFAFYPFVIRNRKDRLMDKAFQPVLYDQRTAKYPHAVNAFRSSLIPSADVYLQPALHLTTAIQTLVTPRPTPSDFWDIAMAYEHVLQDYVPRLLDSAAGYFKTSALAEIAPIMTNLVRPTAVFRKDIQGALVARNITLDVLTEELEELFMGIAHDLEDIPPSRDAPGHAQRVAMIDEILDSTEAALTDVATRYGIQDTVLAVYLGALKPQVLALVITIGDVNEQYPQLLPVLVFSVAALLIPEAWILRPFLSLFGFGPAGPVKGSAAAWLQSRFWGAAVKTGSWFAWLQAAGMGVIPKWGPPVTSSPLLVGGLLFMFLLCCCRR